MSGTTLGGKIKSLVISDTPFTSAQLNQKRELVSKYMSFWDKAKFRKGWSKHLFDRHEVKDLLDEAAEIVVRIREALGPQHNKRRAILPTHGNAHEYLWNLESNPLENKEAFVRDIVHATFSNTAGYLGALSLSVVDDAIAQARAIRAGSQQERIRSQEAARESLLDNWKKVTDAMEQLFPNNSDPLLLLQPQDANQKKHILSMEDRHIRRLLEAFVLINSHLSSFKTVRTTETEESSQQQDQDQDVQQQHVSSSTPEPMRDDGEKSVSETPQTSEKADQQQSGQGSETEEAREPSDHPSSSSSSESPSEGTKMEDVSDSQEEPKGKDALRHSSACLLRVGKVADGVESLSGHIKEIADQIKALQESSSSSDEEEAADPRKELKLIEKLQHQTVGYTDGLMRNLFELDSIVGSESARPKRREQVLRIQNLLKDIDAINSQLHELHQSLKKEAESKVIETPSPSSSSSSVPAPQSPAPQPEDDDAKSTPKEEEKGGEEGSKDDRALAHPSSSSSSSSSVAVPEKSQEEKKGDKEELEQLWRKLKLDPQLEVRQDRKAYYVIGMIPGMKREDVDIAVDDKKNTVTIKGFRGPTPKELQIMARQLLEMDRRRAYNRFYPQHENQVLRLLRLGSGRFGSFSETYNIPRDAVPDKIAASYEDGHLIVTIPRVPPPPQPQLRPQRDFFNTFFPPQHHNRPYGFFDDEDLFW